MSRLLSDLDLPVRKKAVDLLTICQEQGIVLKVTQTYRTFIDQAVLYNQGRSTIGKIVTYAPPGYSWHNWKRAFDIAIAGYPEDMTPKDYYDGPWGHIGEIAEGLGLEWGGRWKNPDSPHFQYTGSMNLMTLIKKFPKGLEGVSES